MKIKILLYGVLTEIASCNALSLPDIHDTDALKAKMLEKFPEMQKYKFLVSVNQEIKKENTSLQPNDEVALLPPFAGG